MWRPPQTPLAARPPFLLRSVSVALREIITEDSARRSRSGVAAAPVPVVLHLVLMAYPDEPSRVGESAPVWQPSCLGREHPAVQGAPPLVTFQPQRPGALRPGRPLTAPTLSRRQLELEPQADGRVLVRNVGRRVLTCSGQPTTECLVAAGDTLMLEDTALLLVEARPLALPPCPSYPHVDAFPFGEADPFGMVGESPAAWALREALGSAAAADAHLLLLGESGAGKEVAAAVVHGLSPRRRGPLVARNAATLPGTLLDAELFGNARGYPNTGTPERPGMIGEADGGHLLLDELGELHAGHQTHLLRVMDTHGEYHRLGEAQARRSDFRLIGATNREPDSLKHDLLARFAHRVVVPPLHERTSDIPLLLRALVKRLHARTPQRLRRFLDDGEPSTLHLEPHLLCALLRHRYALHVRELHRLLELSLTTSPADTLELTPEVEAELASGRGGAPSPAAFQETLPPPARHPVAHTFAAGEAPGAEPSPRGSVGAARRRARSPSHSAAEVSAALDATGGNVTAAAAHLGVSRFALTRLIRAHGLVRRFGSDE